MVFRLTLFRGYFCSFSYLDIFLRESLSPSQFSEMVPVSPYFLVIYNINFTSVRSYILRPNTY